mgnify:CR=1 FL=1
MVIENTKTKAGSDFYDLFYSSYLAKNIDGEKIVKIDEKLAIASNTLIQVVVGDQLVMQFIIKKFITLMKIFLTAVDMPKQFRKQCLPRCSPRKLP